MAGDKELDDLRAEAEAIGVKVDRRWGVDRLREEITAARKSGDLVVEHADEAQSEPPVRAEPGPLAGQPEPVCRAGGHVVYDDGRGWVVEE